MTLVNFQEKGTGSSYWETGELPDIDLMRDSVFLILDQENYYASQEQSPLDISAEETKKAGAAASLRKSTWYADAVS